MKIPRWKKWLSYLKPIKLEEADSDLNPRLTVMLDKGRVQLLSGDAIYSWDDYYYNFSMTFDQLDLEKRNYETVLLLGLGLGSIPYMLEHTFHLDYHYTAVELDETIAELAAEYTLDRIESSVEIITADAEIFVEVCQEQFDMVIIDIFEDNLTPPQFETPEFLDACNELLRPGGILLFNRLYGGMVDTKIAERYYHNVFQKKFPDSWYVDTGGNWVLCYERKI